MRGEAVTASDKCSTYVLLLSELQFRTSLRFNDFDPLYAVVAGYAINNIHALTTSPKTV